jgi:hypothetical protein
MQILSAIAPAISYKACTLHVNELLDRIGEVQKRARQNTKLEIFGQVKPFKWSLIRGNLVDWLANAHDPLTWRGSLKCGAAANESPGSWEPDNNSSIETTVDGLGSSQYTILSQIGAMCQPKKLFLG